MNAEVLTPPQTGVAEAVPIEFAEEREALRHTPDVMWKSAQLRERDLWSTYPTKHAGSEGHIVRMLGGFQLPAAGAVIDGKGRLYHSGVAAADVAARLAQTPHFSPRGEQWAFTPDAAVENLGAAAFFCRWPGLHNYAHFLLGDLVSLAMLEDVGALDRYPLYAPPLDAWRRQMVGLLIGERAQAIREIAAPVVRFDEAVFAGVQAGPLLAPTMALGFMRHRMMAAAADIAPPQKPIRRLYFMQGGARRSSEHKRLFAELGARKFSIIDASALSPVELIMLISEAQVIVGHTGPAMANMLFAGAGARVIEIQPRAEIETGWVGRLCAGIGVRWSAFALPPAGDGLPLSGLVPAPIEEALSVDALLAHISAKG